MISLMEVCGTHTAAIFKTGIRSIVGSDVRLVSGPGCPVCVTPTSFIDRCIEEAVKKDTTLCSFGDMMKVPGSKMSLSEAKGRGADVQLMYSPFEVLKKASERPDRRFVIAAVGFETTAPVYAVLIEELLKKNIENVFLITSLKSAIPAIEWVAAGETQIDGFICPGNVSVITGEGPYIRLSEKYSKPFVIAGFDGGQILAAIRECKAFAEKPHVKNLYTEAVKSAGNAEARDKINKYFKTEDAVWRGLGTLPGSGYYLREDYAEFDIDSRSLTSDAGLPKGCRCADVICGRIDPVECGLFGGACTPQTPIGPCMVSGEGACGIWYQNR